MSNGTERTKVDPVWLAIAFFALNFLFTLVVLFALGYAVNDLQELVAMKAEQAREVEERVAGLEEKVGSLVVQIADLNARLGANAVGDLAFRQQVLALEFGTFYAEAFSDLEASRGVCFTETPDNLNTSGCDYWGARPGETFNVVLYSTVTGGVIEEFDVGSLVNPGDYVIAWYDTAENVSQLGLPLSPVYEWTPYYWNEGSGLAVAIARFTGGVLRP